MEKRSLQPRIQQAGAWLPSWHTALRAAEKRSWASGKACQEAAADLRRVRKRPRRFEHHFQRETSSSFPPPIVFPPFTTLVSSPMSIMQMPFPSNTVLLKESAEGAEKPTDMGTRTWNHTKIPPITLGLEHQLNSLTLRRTRPFIHANASTSPQKSLCKMMLIRKYSLH